MISELPFGTTGHASTRIIFGAAALGFERPELRQLLESNGVTLGPAFAGLIATHAADDTPTTVAELILPGPLRAQQGAYRIHPVLLDACFQSVAAHPSVAKGVGGLLLPLSVRRLRICDPARNPRYCLVRVNPHEGSGIEADLDVLDESGASVLTSRRRYCTALT